MTNITIDQAKLKAFADAFCTGNAEGTEEITAYLAKLGKKSYLSVIEIPELLIFMADRALIPLEDVDKYLLDISWIDYPAVIETLLRYKKNPPKMQVEVAEQKEAAASSDPKNDWITEKMEDGTLRLVSYKGSSTNIHVPIKIGKAAVSTIGEFAFTPNKPRLKKEMAEQRAKIKSVEIPEGITAWEGDFSNSYSWNYIGSFQGCSALETLNIPNSIKKLPKGMCRSSGIVEIVLPESVEVIGAEAFRECSRLKSINFPSNIKELQTNLFYRSALEEFNWPMNEGTTVLPIATFSFCTKMQKVVLPSTLKNIESYAFSNCVKLAELQLPESLKEIGGSAFFGCAALEELTIPEGVREIKEGTFTGCKKLSRLYLPASIESIKPGTRSRHSETRTFFGCENLVIYAPEGSYAQKYALENNIPFEADTGMQRPKRIADSL